MKRKTIIGFTLLILVGAILCVYFGLWNKKPQNVTTAPQSSGVPTARQPSAQSAAPELDSGQTPEETTEAGPVDPAVAAREQAAREEWMTIVKTWETRNAKPLKGGPFGSGVLECVYLPPMDDALRASLKNVLSKYSLTAESREREFLATAGVSDLHRYIAYHVNPAQADDSKDSMWMVETDDQRNVRIDPLTESLKVEVRENTRATPLYITALSRYGHLFSVVDDDPGNSNISRQQ